MTKPPFEDLPQPCPACGTRFESWRAGAVDCARCPNCQSVLLDVTQLESFAKGVAPLKGSEDVSSGKGSLREGELCPCGERLRLSAERAWLVCDACQRAVLAWRDVLEIAGNRELADVDWGMLALRESDLPLTNWFTDAKGRGVFFIIGGLFLIAASTYLIQLGDTHVDSWREHLDGDLGIAFGVLSVLGGIATLAFASLMSKGE